MRNFISQDYCIFVSTYYIPFLCIVFLYGYKPKAVQLFRGLIQYFR